MLRAFFRRFLIGWRTLTGELCLACGSDDIELVGRWLPYRHCRTCGAKWDPSTGLYTPLYGEQVANDDSHLR